MCNPDTIIDIYGSGIKNKQTVKSDSTEICSLFKSRYIITMFFFKSLFEGKYFCAFFAGE